MKQIFHILQFKALAFIRGNTKLNLVLILKNLVSAFIYIGFSVGSYFFALRLIQFLIEDVKVGLFLLHEFISMVLFIFFVSVNVGNIIVSYSTLYKSNEVVYFFSKPVNPSNIFLIKFLDNFLYSSSTLLLILISVMVAYASYFTVPITSFVYLFVMNIIPFIISAGSLGVIFLLLMIKLASRFGIKRVLYTIALVYIFFVFIFFKINSPLNLVNEVMRFYPLVDRNEYLGELIPAFVKYLPNNWLAQAAFSAIKHDSIGIINSTINQIGLSAFLFFAAYALGRKWYLSTWLQNQAIASEYADRKRHMHKIISFEKSRLNPLSESIIKKDYLVFVREPSQLVHFIILLFLIAVFISSVSGIRYFRLGGHYLITIIYLSIYLFNLLLISTFALRFIFPLISLEGLAFWKIKSAPVNPKFYLIKKITPIFLIVFFVGQGLSLFANFRLGINMVFISALITLVATSTISFINLGMGSLFVNYKEKNPIRISSSQGASISFLMTIIYMLFVVLLLFQPLTEIFLAIRINEPIDFSILFIPSAVIIIPSLIIFMTFARISLTSLKKDF